MFSVVIPLYNKAQSIGATINSVLQQSFKDFEIIIINDGSTDDSTTIVKSFVDKRIKLINQTNQGVSSARNKGIEVASYNWIAFLDGDDLWLKNHLQIIYTLILRNSDKLVFSSSFANKVDDIHNDNIDTSKVMLDYFNSALHGEVLWTSVVVVNKSCFAKVGHFDITLARGEDIDMWIRLAKQYPIVKSSKITAIYRLEAENRACNTYLDYDKSIISKIDLNNNISKSEKNYKKKIIRERLIYYIYNRDLKIVWKIIKRYKFNII